jgi:hypothetical protein
VTAANALTDHESILRADTYDQAGSNAEGGKIHGEIHNVGSLEKSNMEQR